MYCIFYKLIFLYTTVCIKSFHMNTSFIKNPYMYINNITQFFTINGNLRSKGFRKVFRTFEAFFVF